MQQDVLSAPRADLLPALTPRTMAEGPAPQEAPLQPSKDAWPAPFSGAAGKGPDPPSPGLCSPEGDRSQGLGVSRPAFPEGACRELQAEAVNWLRKAAEPTQPGSCR